MVERSHGVGISDGHSKPMAHTWHGHGIGMGRVNDGRMTSCTGDERTKCSSIICRHATMA